MTFQEWWESKGREEFATRMKNCEPIYHDLKPDQLLVDDAEWIAKHCAWNAWLVSMTQQAAEMTKVA